MKVDSTDVAVPAARCTDTAVVAAAGDGDLTVTLSSNLAPGEEVDLQPILMLELGVNTAVEFE